MELDRWAQRHGVTPAALSELRQMFTSSPGFAMPESVLGESEAAVQTRVRLEASRVGTILWRNNVGVATDRAGRPVRYGLANDSPAVNKRFKSSDLIGIKPVTITPEMVGRRLGQFVARETKRGGWRYAGTPRERAQQRFLEFVAGLGGNACFASEEGTLY